MSRSQFILLPWVIAVLAGAALAQEPAAAKVKSVPLWQQETNKEAPGANSDVKAEAAKGRGDAPAEAKPDSQEARMQEARPASSQDAAPQAREELKQEAAQPAKVAGKDPAKAPVKEMEFGTQDQYRECMYSEDRIKDLRKMLEEHIVQNNEAMLEIKKQASLLLEMQGKVVLSDDAQVEAFNKRTQDHNRLVKEANDASDKLKLELESFNVRSMQHNQSCASLIVKMSDRDAVMKERTPAVSQ